MCPCCPLALQIAYMDKLLQRIDVPRPQHQLLTLVCLMVAAKYEEAEERLPNIPQLNEIAGTAFPKHAFNQMEVTILNQYVQRPIQ